MNTIEINQAMQHLRQLWPGWEPTHEIKGVIAKRMRFMQLDWFLEAAEDVAAFYSSPEPKIPWFFREYEKIRTREGEKKAGNREEQKQIAEEELQREVDACHVMINSALLAMSTQNLAYYRDRLNSMDAFSLCARVVGDDSSKWTQLQRDWVWARSEVEEPLR